MPSSPPSAGLPSAHLTQQSTRAAGRPGLLRSFCESRFLKLTEQENTPRLSHLQRALWPVLPRRGSLPPHGSTSAWCVTHSTRWLVPGSPRPLPHPWTRRELHSKGSLTNRILYNGSFLSTKMPRFRCGGLCTCHTCWSALAFNFPNWLVTVRLSEQRCWDTPVTGEGTTGNDH